MSTDFTKPCAEFRPSPEDIKAWNGDLDAITDKEDLDSVMKSLASIADEYDRLGMDRLQCTIYHKALDWLQSLKGRLEEAVATLDAVRVIEYTSCCANSDGKPVRGTERPMYMVYNRRVIGDADAEEILKQGRQDLDPRVVVLWPSQAFALFPKLKEDYEREDGNAETDGET